MQDPVIARQFVKNPDAFVEDYGYEGGINLDEGMLKLILALGDEDINKAVNQNDMLKVLDLMESKGLLDGVDEIGISLTNEQIRKIYENLGIKVDASEVDSRIAVLAVPVVVYAVAIAYSQAAVLYNVAGALNVLGAINVYAWSELWGRSNEISEIVNGQLPLKLWNLKGHSENTYMVVDEYVNIQVGRAIAIMKEHNSDLLRYIDEDELARLVKYNIIQNCK